MRQSDRAELTAPLGFVMAVADRPSGLRFAPSPHEIATATAAAAVAASDDAPDTKRTPEMADLAPETPRAPPPSGRTKMLATAPHHRLSRSPSSATFANVVSIGPARTVREDCMDATEATFSSGSLSVMSVASEPCPQSTTRPSAGMMVSLPATSLPITSSMIFDCPPTTLAGLPPPMSEGDLRVSEGELQVDDGAVRGSLKLALQPTVAMAAHPFPPSFGSSEVVAVASPFDLASAIAPFAKPPHALAPFASLDAFQSTFLTTPAQRFHIVVTSMMIGVMALMLTFMTVERRRAASVHAAQPTVATTAAAATAATAASETPAPVAAVPAAPPAPSVAATPESTEVAAAAPSPSPSPSTPITPTPLARNTRVAGTRGGNTPRASSTSTASGARR